jgi:FAD:protein FMN transferase
MKVLKNKRSFLTASLGAGLLGATGTLSSPDFNWRDFNWSDRALHGFGTTLMLRAGHANLEALELGLDAAITAIRHIESQMSLFDPTSALSRLNRQGYLPSPDPHLVAVLQMAQEVASSSQGAFDITVQPLWRLWARATKSQVLPTQPELQSVRSLVGWQSVQVSSDEIRFARTGMEVTLNGIAQGYAADRAKQVLESFGIKHALINTGEWSMVGASEDRTPWRLGLADPRRAEQLLTTLASIAKNGESVATSNDFQNAFGADRRYHHILDPRSGESPPDVALVCVLAPSCALADALTKVFFMAGFENALAVATQWNVKAIVMNKAGSIVSTERNS